MLCPLESIGRLGGLEGCAGQTDLENVCIDSTVILKERSVTAVIPPKANRKAQRDCDWYLCKERHVVECMFKYYRRIATRFEKKASRFKEMLAFAAVLLWLR